MMDLQFLKKALNNFFVQEKEKINNKKKVTKHNNSASVVWKTQIWNDFLKCKCD